MNVYKTGEFNHNINSKINFKEYCNENLQLIKNIAFPKINLYNDYEAVLVYFEDSSHIEFIIKNTILKLDKLWSFTIVCGYFNYEFMISICKRISENIKVIKIDEYKIYTENEFWNLFHGEKLLFYSESTLVINENIHDFLHWDYIGSKLKNDRHTNFFARSFCLLTKKFSKNLLNNDFTENNLKIADSNSLTKFVSVDNINLECFAIHNCYSINLNWKTLLSNLKYNQDDLFNPTHYKILNTTLNTLSKKELVNHFKNFGYHEKKKCYIKNRSVHKYIHEYCDFDIHFFSKHYKYFNPELVNLNQIELLKHYNTIGKYQNKKSYIETIDPDFEKYLVNQNENLEFCNNCIVFINDSTEINDETIFLYEYVIYLQQNNIYENTIIFDVVFNEKLLHLYNKLKSPPVYYCNNLILLRELLDFHNPKFIYSNADNLFLSNIQKFTSNIIKRSIFHFHDNIVFSNSSIQDLKENIIYCGNEKIIEYISNSYGIKNAQLFRPFINLESFEILEKYQPLNLFNNDAIRFGMFGIKNYENGYDIFINIVKKMPQYNFIWIGGEYDEKFSPDNYIQICNYINIYKYIDYVDYFLITNRNSQPRFILNALYQNCPCIVLENNMTYKIDVPNFFVIENYNYDFNKIIEFLKNNIVLNKKCDQTFQSSQYILDNYTSPIINYERILTNDKEEITESIESLPETKPIYFSSPYFHWKHYLLLHDDLIQNGVSNYNDAIKHWLETGSHHEYRQGIINLFELEKYLNKYNTLKKIIIDNNSWVDNIMEDLIKIKCQSEINLDQYIYENYYYTEYDDKFVSKIKNAAVQWFFYDNYIEIAALPRLNGYIDLSSFGIDKNHFDVSYFYAMYKNCYFKPNNHRQAINIWNLFSKSNNYLGSVYHELFEDINFDWEYYVFANRLQINSKKEAFLHWNKFGKKNALITSKVNIKSAYEQHLHNSYNITISENIIKYKNENVFNNMYESCVNVCKKNNDPFFSNLKKINSIDNFDSLILIIDFPNYGGGTTEFINRIVSYYKSEQTFLVARNFNNAVYFYIDDNIIVKKSYNNIESIEFLKNNQSKFTKIFINSIIGHSEDFVNELFNLNVKVDTITHDYSLLYSKPLLYYHELMSTKPDSYFPINKCNIIITQNIKNTCVYGNFVDKKKFVIAEIPDYCNRSTRIITSNKQITIGVLGNINNLKGYYIVEELILYAKKQDNIKIIIFGNIPYSDSSFVEQYNYSDIDHLNSLLVKHNPNLWIETSIWPETYSYTLTLLMLTGLPIYYQKKNYPSVVQDRLFNYNNAYEYDNINWLIKNIDIVIAKKQNFFYTIEPKIFYNPFWDSYFGKPNSEKNDSNIIHDILAYCVYFPQFHSFPENDKNFYKGFTDTKNLGHFIKQIDSNDSFTPSNKVLKIKNINDYDLYKNKKLIQTQFKIIEDYPIQGFAIYYYWFSLNTITNQNMIMDKVIDKFFDPGLDTKGKKVFFIWANEDWTKNVAFGEINDRIENHYTMENIKKNAENLIKYFKHDNYLKIENKPVLFVHHPWFIKEEILDMVKSIFNKYCVECGFFGVHFIINSMVRNEHLGHLQYDFHFDYKNNDIGYISIDESGKRIIDYKKYIDNINYNSPNIKSLCFDFDNRPRLCLPDRIKHASICINSTEKNHRFMLKQTIDSYKTSYKGVNKLLLINSWNEWGERLAIEPSNEKGFYYMDLLKEYLRSKN